MLGYEELTLHLGVSSSYHKLSYNLQSTQQSEMHDLSEQNL